MEAQIKPHPRGQPTQIEKGPKKRKRWRQCDEHPLRAYSVEKLAVD